jgi:hypothetical protein
MHVMMNLFTYNSNLFIFLYMFRWQAFSIGEPILNFKIMTNFQYEKRQDDTSGKSPPIPPPVIVNLHTSLL